MKKIIRRPLVLWGIILITLLCLAPTLLFFYWMSPPHQGLRESERDFLRNKDHIVFVRDYLVNSEYENPAINCRFH